MDALAILSLPIALFFIRQTDAWSCLEYLYLSLSLLAVAIIIIGVFRNLGFWIMLITHAVFLSGFMILEGSSSGFFILAAGFLVGTYRTDGIGNSPPKIIAGAVVVLSYLITEAILPGKESGLPVYAKPVFAIITTVILILKLSIQFGSGIFSRRNQEQSLIERIIQTDGVSLGQESESILSFYQTFFDNGPFGLAVRSSYDPNKIHINGPLAKMLGYETEEGLLVDRYQLTHFENRESSKRLEKKLVSGEITHFTVEKEYIKQDGSILPVKITRFLLPFKGRDFIFGIIENIEESRRSDLARRQSEEQFRFLFENGFEGILVFDTKRKKIVDVNPQLLSYFKVSSKENFLKKGTLHFSPPFQKSGRTSEKELEWILNRAKKENQFMFQWTHQLEDGTVLETEVNTMRSPNSPHIFTSFFKDITQRKKQEEIIQKQLLDLDIKNKELEEYIESNMQLENFAYIASHDLKAPIRTIVGFSQLLTRTAKDKLDAEEQEYLGFIITATRNMAALIDDLLTFSQVKTEKLLFREVDLNEVVEIVMGSLHATIAETKAKIKIDGLPSSIIADYTMLRQLFQNLISNAIKFRKPGTSPNIKIQVSETSVTWNFRVSDDGIGIDKKHHEKVFLLFRKLHRQEHYQGTGIGLALCKKVVELHGGQIRISSELGKGTTFHFSIRKNLDEINAENINEPATIAGK